MQCEGHARKDCMLMECIDTTETPMTTRDDSKNTCLGRCDADPSEDEPGDCICTEECTQTFVPDECCNDFYARCVVDHSNGESLVDPGTGIDTGLTGPPLDNAGGESTPSPNEPEQDSLLLIVACVLGVVVVVIVVVIVVRCCKSKQMKKAVRTTSLSSSHAVTYPHLEMNAVQTRPQPGQEFMTI